MLLKNFLIYAFLFNISAKISLVSKFFTYPWSHIKRVGMDEIWTELKTLNRIELWRMNIYTGTSSLNLKRLFCWHNKIFIKKFDYAIPKVTF